MPPDGPPNLPYISEIWAKTDVWGGADAVMGLLEAALTLPTAYVHAAPSAKTWLIGTGFAGFRDFMLSSSGRTWRNCCA